MVEAIPVGVLTAEADEVGEFQPANHLPRSVSEPAKFGLIHIENDPIRSDRMVPTRCVIVEILKLRGRFLEALRRLDTGRIGMLQYTGDPPDQQSEDRDVGDREEPAADGRAVETAPLSF